MSNFYLQSNASYEYNNICCSLLVIPCSAGRPIFSHAKDSAIPAPAQNRSEKQAVLGATESHQRSPLPNLHSSPPPPPEPLVGPSISGLAFSPGCCSPATSLGFPLRLLSVIYVSEASGSGNISLPRESFCVWGSESSPFVAAASLSRGGSGEGSPVIALHIKRLCRLR